MGVWARAGASLVDTFRQLGAFLPATNAMARANEELAEAQYAAEYPEDTMAELPHPMAVESWAHHIGWRVRYDHPSGAVEHGTLMSATSTERTQRLVLTVLFENAAAPVPVDPEYLWLVRRPVDPERTPIERNPVGNPFVGLMPERAQSEQWRGSAGTRLPRIGERPPVPALVDQLAEEMRNSTGDVGLDDDGWTELAEVALTFMKAQLVVLIEEWEG